MTYQQTLEYLDSFINYEKKIDYPYSKAVFGLKRINLLLEKLGSPHKDLKVIHITGSKGKGSTACFCASILKEAGFKTGLYTSPHLDNFRERIRIDGELIPEQDLIDLTETMKPHIEEIARPSFFEIYTALAFLYFGRKKVDLAVVEVGLGGRLDATNVVTPMACVLTPISFEHTEKLGNTLTSIAAEKSGIIKEKCVVISSPQEKEALDVIRRASSEKKAPLYVVGENIFYRQKAARQTAQIFDVKGIFDEYKSLNIRLLGDHQLANAAAAVAAIETLRFFGIKVPKEAVKKGLSGARWPGRIEVAAKNPLVILDGAQNAASAKALSETIKKYFSHQKLILIIGISKDKDAGSMIRILEAIADEIIITRANLPRAADPLLLSSFFSPSRHIEIIPSVKEAIQKAREKADKEDLILVCGSLFVVAEARQALGIANLHLCSPDMRHPAE